MRRRIRLAFIALTLAMTFIPVCYAADTDHTITGFAALEQSDFYYEGDPSEEELASALPKEISVYLDGQKSPVSIPVSWKAVEDFADTDFYFYSMEPVWAKEYALSADLDPMTDVPWIVVFRQVSEKEIGAGESQLDIPSEDLEPVRGLSSGEVSRGASSSSNVKKTYEYLTGTLGLNMAAACGVMTNLYAESGIQPNNLENRYNIAYGLSDSEYTKRVDKGKKDNGKYTSGSGKTRYFTTDYSGYGICQWTTSGRRTKVLKAAVKQDVSVGNLKMQLGVMKAELEDSYPQVWATLKGVPNSAAGVYLSAAHFCACYEIPANTNNTAISRAKTALSSYWKTYNGKSASATGASFLGLCGYTYPRDLKKGGGMTVSGQVISNYNVTSVTAKITDSKGKTKYSQTRKPGCKIYSLYNFDSSMKFKKLAAGSYTYSITAKDSKGKSVTVKHGFKVSGTKTSDIARGCATKDLSTTEADGEKAGEPTKPSGKTDSGLRGVKLNYPAKLKKGNAFKIKGKVKSDYPLKKVVVMIQTAEGKKVQRGAKKLSKAKKYSVSKLNSKLHFNKLSKGSYIYIVKAADRKQTKTLLKKPFQVE